MRIFTTLLLALLFTVFSITGCMNQNGGAGNASGTATTTKTSVGSSPSGAPLAGNGILFSIITAQFIPSANNAAGATGASGGTGAAVGAVGATGATGASGGDMFTIFFNANNPTFNLSNFCAVQSNGNNNIASKACKCHFVWPETNLSDQSVITRSVDTDPTQITAFQVQCPAPDVWQTEITDNTIVKITFIPDFNAGNNSGFTTNTLNFTKQPITATGDFRDAEGRSFRNIYHYTCFDQFQKNLSIIHALGVATQNAQTGQSVSAPIANKFLPSGGGTSSFSAQSYYFDFYVRSNEAGSINSTSSSGFICPQVNVNGTPSFFPLDSSFALAVQSSASFPQSVASATVAPVASTPAGIGPQGVLGFAALPNADGSCPAFVDSTGKIRRTFRLRKFSALYPIRYDADADIKDQSQPSNTIYIIDRPVNKVGQDPLKPITRFGPKPCPFSFKTAQFGQKCSTDASLAGWSVDGTQINGDPNCPIYPPPPDNYVKSDGTLVIRPFRPFLPHYLEDASFRACSFPSSTPVDPELVLSHDDTIFPAPVGPFDFYCAKYYPSAGSLIPPPGGPTYDKAPGDCDVAITGAAIKTDKTFACSRTFDPTNQNKNTPKAGCCQICAGPDCTLQGGGAVPQARNAAFTPPAVLNPPQSINSLLRSVPNTGTGCYDPSED